MGPRAHFHVNEHAGVPAMNVETATSAAILDVDGTLARFGGDRELFFELISILVDDAPALFNELHAAVTAGKTVDVEHKAHALKGLLLNCGGVRAATVAQQLEDAAHNRRVTNGADMVDTLAAELDLLIEAIRGYRRGTQ